MFTVSVVLGRDEEEVEIYCCTLYSGQNNSFSWMPFSDRSKETDWQPYFTTRLVDDFGTHLRVFRKAQQRIAEKGDQMKGNVMI